MIEPTVIRVTYWKISSTAAGYSGPGADKTYWLVNHIKKVITRSERLLPAMKIVCISYTNVAANHIIGRLGAASEDCEISRIHSFFILFRLTDDLMCSGH